MIHHTIAATFAAGDLGLIMLLAGIALCVVTGIIFWMKRRKK